MMKLSLEIDAQYWRVQTESACDISVPLQFVREDLQDGRPQQPVHFEAPPASARPYRSKGFVGNIAQGGSCRVETLSITPHCNGTHTETRLHISEDGPCVQSSLSHQGALLVPASVVTLSPVGAQNCNETYHPPLTLHDRVMTRMALADLCGEIPDAFMTALVIRTLPNGPDKKTRRYTADASPPFLTLPAAHYLISRGVQHLLVDVPSVDRYHDDGHLSVHHALLAADRLGATITELIYVPDTLEDGRYLLSLQCPNFDTDAVPSRPVLLPLEEITKGCI